MKDLVKQLEELPYIVKVLLTIFVGFYSNLLRLFRSIAAEDLLGIVLAVILLVSGGFVILWIIDLIMVVLDQRIWWID